MKHLKTHMSILLISVMLTAMSGTAFAEPDDDPSQTNTVTITITQSPNSTTQGTAGSETYSAYKIFDVTKISTITEPVTTDDTIEAQSGSSYEAPTGFAYSISADSPWLNVVQTYLTGNNGYLVLTPVPDGTSYGVTLKTGVDQNETTAKAIAAILKEHIPTGVTGTTVTSGTAVTVDDGYYLIVSDFGTNLILATTSIEITAKDEYIVDEKVEETASVTIGESETYYVKVYLPASINPEKIVTVHDLLASELSFNDDIKVYIGTSEDPGSTVAEYKALTYSELDGHFSRIISPTGESTPCSFHIDITVARETDEEHEISALESLAGKWLVFKYSAELTSAADPDGDGYVNKEFSTYSNYTTTPSVVIVKTYDFTLNKKDSSTPPKELTGAEFEMYDVDPSTKKYYTDDTYQTESDTETEYFKLSAEPLKFLKVEGGYKKADSNDTGTVTTLEAGSINVAGFGAGTYYMLETKAPDGYNKLEHPLEITFTDAGVLTVKLGNETLTLTNDAFDVINQSGTVLPSTGGIGTALFYVGGGVLLVGAALLLVKKNRGGER